MRDKKAESKRIFTVNGKEVATEWNDVKQLEQFYISTDLLTDSKIYVRSEMGTKK